MEPIFNRYSAFQMELGECIKKMGEVMGLSQKKVALACKMDTAKYSCIETKKTLSPTNEPFPPTNTFFTVEVTSRKKIRSPIAACAYFRSVRHLTNNNPT